MPTPISLDGRLPPPAPGRAARARSGFGAAAVIGAQRYERTNRRNGKRLKTVATTAGEVELAIPELRTGSFFPSLLHPRRRVDKALYAVICSAWIEGVSTRKAWRPGQGPGQ